MVDSAWPVTIDVVLDIFQDLSMSFSEIHVGRVVHVIYRLSPLSSFAVDYELRFGEISDLKLNDIVFAIQKAKEGVFKLEQYRTWMERNSKYFPASERDEVSKQCRKVARNNTSFISILRELIRSYRKSPNEDLCECMNDAIEQLVNSCSSQVVDKYIDKDRVEYVKFSVTRRCQRRHISHFWRMVPQLEMGGRSVVLLLNLSSGKRYPLKRLLPLGNLISSLTRSNIYEFQRDLYWLIYKKTYLFNMRA